MLKEWNKIYLSDCVSEMQKMKDETFNSIIIDPPYNIGVNFGNNKQKVDLKQYAQWAGEWLVEAERLLKPSGTLYVYGFSEILAHISVNMTLPHRWLIWHYTNKTVPSSKFWQRSHESIIVAWKDKTNRIFNRDMVREPYTETFIKGYSDGKRKRPAGKGRFAHGDDLVPGKVTSYTVNKLGALPRDVIKISALAGGAGSVERIGWCRTCNQVFVGKQKKLHSEHDFIKHPTQKPAALTEKLLKASCNDRSKVLIPFAGSGSECAVAKKMGHDFIGFDLNEEYVQMANQLVNTLTPAS